MLLQYYILHVSFFSINYHSMYHVTHAHLGERMMLKRESEGNQTYIKPTATSRTLSCTAKLLKPSQNFLALFPTSSTPSSKNSRLSSNRIGILIPRTSDNKQKKDEKQAKSLCSGCVDIRLYVNPRSCETELGWFRGYWSRGESTRGWSAKRGVQVCQINIRKKLNFELQRPKKPHTMASITPAKLSEEEIDDLIYFARAGEQEEFNSLKTGMLNPLVKRTTIIGTYRSLGLLLTSSLIPATDFFLV